jgi:DNA-binding transcriptional ArsR family regulator
MDDISTYPSKITIIKTLSNPVRLEALFRLFIEQRLSLSELSKILKKSKNTVIYHMKYLTAIELVRESNEKVEGSIKPVKIYERNPFFWKTMFKNFEEIANVPPENILDASGDIIQWNILLFETIREFLRYLCTFYEVNKKNIETAAQASEFHRQYHVPRDLVPLSETAYHEYMNIYEDFKQQFMHILEEDTINFQKTITKRPYLAMNMVIPIQKLVEFRDKVEIQKKTNL